MDKNNTASTLKVTFYLGIICFNLDSIQAFHRVVQLRTPVYKRLLDDFWLWRMQTDPELATTLHIHDFDDRLETFTEQAFSQRKPDILTAVTNYDTPKTTPKTFITRGNRLSSSTFRAKKKSGSRSFVTAAPTKWSKVPLEESCSQFITRIDQLDLNSLTNWEVANTLELRHQLKSVVDGYQWRSYSSYNPINNLEGVHKDTSLWIDAMKFDSLPDFQKYKRRLTALASQINEQTSLMQDAVVSAKTYHRVSVTDVPIDLDRLLGTGARESQFFRPFNESLDLLQVSGEERMILRKEASQIIEDQVYPSYRKLKTFLQSEYLPHSRPSISVSSLPRGLEYYKARLQWYLADDISPHQLYRKGNDAMFDIMTQIDHIKASVGYTDSVNNFLRYVQGASRFFFTTESKLLEEFTKLTQVTIPANLHKVLSWTPHVDFIVEPMQFDGPEAILWPGSEDGEMPPVFFVNVENPFKRPKWKLLSTSLRETIPGKLLQMTSMRNLSLPHFRKYPEQRKLYEVPFHFPSHAAYTEGWSLYAEKLGYDMGLITDPYLELGQLFSELYHTALLVADSGIHYLGWERAYAVNYLHEVTGFGSLEAGREIDKIITLPGQASAPAYGYMKIKGLREKAQHRCGPLFDIKEFHDEILKLGPVSLRYLTVHINRWIEEKSPVYKAVVSTSGGGLRYKESGITCLVSVMLIVQQFMYH